MDTPIKEKPITVATVSEMGELFGKMYAFNNSLKLYHWHVTGKGSYAEHMALDQALGSLSDVLDRLVETSYAMHGNIKIVIPETTNPANVIAHAENFFKYIDYQRDLFKESFTSAILDDYQESIQQLLYRLKRLS